jgi:hypothetical protein
VRAQLTMMPDSEKAEAVRAFDTRFGEMDLVLWHLAVNSRAALLGGQSSPVVEALVWKVKSWWGVQGVESRTKACMADALAAMTWSPDLFQEALPASPGAEEHAYELVSELVSRCMSIGVPRREYSLASKVLHWLLPWRVPAYDDNVRRSLGIPSSWDYPQKYRQVAQQVHATAQAAERNPAWVGSLKPNSPVRALDKCLWWIGGGNAGCAAQVQNPWLVLDQLRLERPCRTAG